MGMTVKHNGVEYGVVELSKHVIVATKITVPLASLIFTDATETIFVKNHTTPIVVAEGENFTVLVKPNKEIVADKDGNVSVALFSKPLLKKIRNLANSQPSFNPPRIYQDTRGQHNDHGRYQRA